MKIYLDKRVPKRLIVDDCAVNKSGADISSLLVFDIYEDGVVSICQDSNIQATSDSLNGIGEALEVGKIEETVDMLKAVIKELEELK